LRQRVGIPTSRACCLLMLALLCLVAADSARASRQVGAGYSADSFYSPTRNIVCHLYRTRPVEMVCTTMNDGFITIVRNDGLLWRGYNHGRWLYPGGPVLPYGRSRIMAGLFWCDSRFTGMTCTALRSGNGFFLNRTSYSLFLGARQVYRTPAPPTYTPPAPNPNFCDTHYCIPNFNNGVGVITQCNDGEWSRSGGRQGACSWHGGVEH
jgi:hypothetical protein